MASPFLRPELCWYQDKCFRINPVHEMYSSDCPKNVKEPSTSGYVENDLYDDEEDDDDDISVQSTDYGYKTTFFVPQSLIKFIVGAKGATKLSIENETSTDVIVPRRNTDDKIVIHGASRRNVCSARRRIEIIASNSRTLLPPNSFTCIPCNTAEMQEAYNVWKAKVLSDDTIKIDEFFFQKSEKLHITLNLASLCDDYDESLACDFLDESKTSVVDPVMEKCGNFKIKFKGLGVFTKHNNPKTTKVLYAKVISEPLQAIANGLAQELPYKGLFKKESDTVKMHMTLLNVSFAPNEKKKPFDCIELLRKYERHDFGTMIIKELHLSRMHSFDENHFYSNIKTINL